MDCIIKQYLNCVGFLYYWTTQPHFCPQHRKKLPSICNWRKLDMPHTARAAKTPVPLKVQKQLKTRQFWPLTNCGNNINSKGKLGPQGQKHPEIKSPRTKSTRKQDNWTWFTVQETLKIGHTLYTTIFTSPQCFWKLPWRWKGTKSWEL